MTRTPTQMVLFIFAFLLMPLAGFGQLRTGAVHEIRGTWSGISLSLAQVQSQHAT
jgi:hypothetical protein